MTEQTFSSFRISEPTRRALAAMNITDPTPIQAKTLPLLLEGRDVIGQARTGSGKTLAFGIPLVERLRAGQGAAQALVLTPTRELASQVAGVLGTLGKQHRLRVVELVGGRGAGPQAAALRGGAEIVVGTPGRVLDLLKSGALRLERLTMLVLDEADEMLDQGFGPDVDRIIAFMPSGAGQRRQNALFSATVPEWVQTVARKLLHDPAEVRVDSGRPAAAAPESVDHVLYDVPEGKKPSVLRALLGDPADGSRRKEEGATLVFGRTRHGVRKLAKQLVREGYQAAALQSDLAQNARDRVIAQFRNGEIPILVATNVAARGLDIADLDRVINYDLPENGALFTHRVGRTGRMGRAGQAITLLAPEDQAKWRQLEKELKAAGLKQGFPRRAWDGPLPELSAQAAAQAPQPQKQGQQRPPRPHRAEQPQRTAQSAHAQQPQRVQQANGRATSSAQRPAESRPERRSPEGAQPRTHAQGQGQAAPGSRRRRFWRGGRSTQQGTAVAAAR